MKKSIRQKLANFKSTYVHIVFCIVLLSSFSPILVNATDKSKAPLAEGVITYLGIQNDQQVAFEVEFENTRGETFYVSISDKEGNVLYRQGFKDSKFSKKFLFNKEEISDTHLVFTIKTSNDTQVESFKVITQVVENTVVTKL